MKQITNRFFKSEIGSVAFVVALTLPIVLMAFTFGVDYLRSSYHKNTTQNALDAAILAGAAKAITDDDAENLNRVTAEVINVFNANLASVSSSATHTTPVVTEIIKCEN